MSHYLINCWSVYDLLVHVRVVRGFRSCTSNVETLTKTAYNSQRREVILDRRIWSTHFENFLATKWTAAKQFRLESSETLIPRMKEMFNQSADLSVESIMINMSYKGRLNVLGNVVRKPLRQFSASLVGGSGPSKKSSSAAAATAPGDALDPNRLRNVAVIAHVDHGKTTLMDWLLCQYGGDIPHERALDSNQLEKERGITIASKITSIPWKENELIMVDTPGHTYFGGEVGDEVRGTSEVYDFNISF
nr:2-oxoglutarate dehydrogenase, mitochondrial-like [Tanacetum cinerariifolium]